MIDNNLLQTFLILSGGVALLGLLFWLTKRMSGKMRNPENQIDLKVLSKASLSSKSSLYVVKAGNRTLLVGSSDGNVSGIADLTKSVGNQTKAIEKSDNPPALDQKQNSPIPLRKDLSFSSFLKSTFKRYN